MQRRTKDMTACSRLN